MGSVSEPELFDLNREEHGRVLWASRRRGRVFVCIASAGLVLTRLRSKKSLYIFGDVLVGLSHMRRRARIVFLALSATLLTMGLVQLIFVPLIGSLLIIFSGLLLRGRSVVSRRYGQH
jgi:hypothetical protein